MDAYDDSSGAIIDFMFPVPRHPSMWLEPGFFRFISYPLPSPPSLVDLFSPAYLFLCEVMPAEGPHAHGTLALLSRSEAKRVTNRALNEA